MTRHFRRARDVLVSVYEWHLDTQNTTQWLRSHLYNWSCLKLNSDQRRYMTLHMMRSTCRVKFVVNHVNLLQEALLDGRPGEG